MSRLTTRYRYRYGKTYHWLHPDSLPEQKKTTSIGLGEIRLVTTPTRRNLATVISMGDKFGYRLNNIPFLT